MFVFLHVPKSAGKTLVSVIEDQHTRRWSVLEKGEWRPDRAAQAVLCRTQAQQDALEVFYGHQSYGVHKYIPQPVTYYTVLRDPVERAISHYYYVLHRYLLADMVDGKPNTHPDRQRALEGRFTLEDYVLSGECLEMDNGQTRIFAGENGLFDITDFGKATDALLEEAKRNLRERVAVVGLTEQFDASLLLLQRLCGWGTPYYVRQNVTRQRPRRSELSASALDAIRERTQLDRPFYEYGVQLFQERVAQQGPAFADDVRRFQERNRRYGNAMHQWARFSRMLRRGARSVSDLSLPRRLA